MNVLFGNRNEFKAFVASSRRLGYKSTILNAILKVLDSSSDADDDDANDKDDGGSDHTTVIVTDGPSPILCFDVERTGASKVRYESRLPRKDTRRT